MEGETGGGGQDRTADLRVMNPSLLPSELLRRRVQDEGLRGKTGAHRAAPILMIRLVPGQVKPGCAPDFRAVRQAGCRAGAIL